MNNITISELIKARGICACIIAQYGNKYLPIFERLDNEVSKREQQQKLLQKALTLHKQNATQNDTQNATQN